MALVQIVLNLQANAANFRQPKKQLAKLVTMSWMILLSVLHQRPVDSLLSLLYLPAVMH